MINITINELALAHMMASAMEAYLVPHPSQDCASHTPVETYGSIFGSIRQYSTDTSINIDLLYASTHVMTNRQPDSCEYRMQSNFLHQAVHTRVVPSLQFLGDYHSHPYTCGEILHDGSCIDARLIERSSLYQFSGTPGGIEGDFGDIRQRVNVVPVYVGLVITLYKMRSEGSLNRARYVDGKSALYYDYSGDSGSGQSVNFRCWVKAYGFATGSSTPIDDSQVQIYCPALGLPRTLFQ